MRINAKSTYYLLKEENRLQEIKKMGNPNEWGGIQKFFAKIASLFRAMLQCMKGDNEFYYIDDLHARILALNSNWGKDYNGIIDEYKNKNQAQVLLANQFAEAMKKQHADILKALPEVYDLGFIGNFEKEFELDQYGFYSKQIDAVQKLAKKQLEEISTADKIQRLWENFLAQKTNENFEKAMDTLGEMKTPAIHRLEADILNYQAKIDKITPVIKARKKKSIYSDRHEAYINELKGEQAKCGEYIKIYKTHWNEQHDQFVQELKATYRRVKRISSKLRKNLSSDKFNELVALSSENVHEKANELKQVYECRVAWDLLQLEPSKNTERYQYLSVHLSEKMKALPIKKCNL